MRRRRAQGIDRPGCFVTNPGREYRALQVLALPIHDLGTIEADRLHLQADLAFTRVFQRQILKLENLGASRFVKANDLGHPRAPESGLWSRSSQQPGLA